MTQAQASTPHLLVAVAIAPGIGLGVSSVERTWSIATSDPIAAFAELDQELAPRWAWWGRETSDQLVARDVTIDRCWDVFTVHRLIFGGWRTSVGHVWAALNGLSTDSVPKMGQLGLLDIPVDDGDTSDPVQPDGHLRPDWTNDGWQTPDRLAVWAELILQAAQRQEVLLAQLPDPSRARSTARSESAADFLCAEMAGRGLPINTMEAVRLIEAAAGRRPKNYDDEDEIRAVRDAAVLSHLDPPQEVNLRNPGEVKRMFEREGFDLPDTRAWRLEQLAESAPLAAAFLSWRKAERIATTYGYSWLDEHVGDGRLRGGWSSSDGAAGRMTASALSLIHI